MAKTTEWTPENIWYAIDSEGFDYFWDGYLGPPFKESDFPEGIAKLAEKYVVAKKALEQAIEELLPEDFYESEEY